MHLCIIYLCIYVSMCLCIYVALYVCIDVSLYLWNYLFMYLWIYVPMHRCIYASTYLRIYVSMFLCIYASMHHLSMHLRIYVFMYLCSFVCMYRCISVSMELFIYVSLDLCSYASMYLCFSVSMYLCIDVSMYQFIYVFMYLCPYVCMHVMHHPTLTFSVKKCIYAELSWSKSGILSIQWFDLRISAKAQWRCHGRQQQPSSDAVAMCLDPFALLRKYNCVTLQLPPNVVKDLHFPQFGFWPKGKPASHKSILIGDVQLPASIFPEQSLPLPHRNPALELWNRGSMASLKTPNLFSSTAMQIKANGTDSSPPWSTVMLRLTHGSCRKL